jgi:hypothetical protein
MGSQALAGHGVTAILRLPPVNALLRGAGAGGYFPEIPLSCPMPETLVRKAVSIGGDRNSGEIPKIIFPRLLT